MLYFITEDLDGVGNREANKNRTETPPPSYDEALAISTMISQQNNDPLYVNLSPSPPPLILHPIQPIAEGATASVLTTTAAAVTTSGQLSSPLSSAAAAAVVTPESFQRNSDGTMNV